MPAGITQAHEAKNWIGVAQLAAREGHKTATLRAIQAAQAALARYRHHLNRHRGTLSGPDAVPEARRFFKRRYTATRAAAEILETVTRDTNHPDTPEWGDVQDGLDDAKDRLGTIT